jgi:hypothetical protein
LDADERVFVEEFRDSLASKPSRMEDCPTADLLLAADAEVLPEHLQREVATHIADCVMCRALIRDLQAAPIDEPAPDQLARIRERVRHLSAGRSDVRLAWRSRGLALATAASFIAVAGLGVRVAYLQRENESLAGRLADVRGSASASPAPAVRPSNEVVSENLAETRRQLEAERTRATSLEAEVAAARAAGGPVGEPQINVPVIDLEPLGSLRSESGQSRSIELPANVTLVTLILTASNPEPEVEYALEIRDGADRVTWQGSGLRRSPLRTFSVALPAKLLPAGDARLRLYALRDRQRQLVDQYSVRIVYK